MDKMNEEEKAEFRAALIRGGIDPEVYERSQIKLAEIETIQNLRWNIFYASTLAILTGGMMKFFPDYLIKSYFGIGLILFIFLIVCGYIFIRGNFKTIYGIDIYSKQMLFPSLFANAIYCFFLMSSCEFLQKVSSFQHGDGRPMYPGMELLVIFFVLSLILCPFVFSSYLNHIKQNSRLK